MKPSYQAFKDFCKQVDSAARVQCPSHEGFPGYVVQDYFNRAVSVETTVLELLQDDDK